MRRRLWSVFLLACVALALFLPPKQDPSLPWWHSVPAAYSLLGFAFTLALTGAERLLKAGLERREHD